MTTANATPTNERDGNPIALFASRFDSGTLPLKTNIGRGESRTMSEQLVSDVQVKNQPEAFTPSDAFGLLRSYSRHRDFVRLALLHVVHDIERRSLTHDASKMLDDEFAGFARINAIARVHKFGSEEYRQSMKQEKTTINLHFSRNSHHPERPKLVGEAAEDARGLPDDFTYWQARDGARMTFLDVIEMVCDWWGARKGYGDSRTWDESVELNFKSKGELLSPEQMWLAREVAAFLGTLER